MSQNTARFAPGQLIQHRLFEYCGVVVDVDPSFQETEQWYNKMAQSNPPKDRPWYRVLVHNSNIETYVAERNLTAAERSRPINHPELSKYFKGYKRGMYQPKLMVS